MDKGRVFSRGFKLAAVRKVVEQGVDYNTVARDLGVSDSLIRKWKKAFDDEETVEINVVGNSSVEVELKRLREENRQLKVERDILKKRWPSLPEKTREIGVCSRAPRTMAACGALPRDASYSRGLLPIHIGESLLR